MEKIKNIGLKWFVIIIGLALWSFASYFLSVWMVKSVVLLSGLQILWSFLSNFILIIILILGFHTIFFSMLFVSFNIKLANILYSFFGLLGMIFAFLFINENIPNFFLSINNKTSLLYQVSNISLLKSSILLSFFMVFVIVIIRNFIFLPLKFVKIARM